MSEPHPLTPSPWGEGEFAGRAAFSASLAEWGPGVTVLI